MKKKQDSAQDWAQSSYETGSTEPPKSRGGLVAILLVLVILLCGAASYLGILNIRLGQQLQQFQNTDVPIQFYPAASEPAEKVQVGDLVLPGVEGREVSAPEQAYYHWPAGVVVT